MGAITPKYPISDESMLYLLHKYPFLKFRKEYGSKLHPNPCSIRNYGKLG